MPRGTRNNYQWRLIQGDNYPAEIHSIYIERILDFYYHPFTAVAIIHSRGKYYPERNTLDEWRDDDISWETLHVFKNISPQLLGFE